MLRFAGPGYGLPRLREASQKPAASSSFQADVLQGAEYDHCFASHNSASEIMFDLSVEYPRAVEFKGLHHPETGVDIYPFPG